MLSSSCEICVDELKKSLYKDKYFETYVKNKDWVKGFIQTTTKQKTTYTISLKNLFSKLIIIFITMKISKNFLCQKN